MVMQYNNPASGEAAGIDSGVDGTNIWATEQINTAYWDRRGLYETRKDRYFSSLADVTAMPTHYGKTIRKYNVVPLLDDRNVNDQGLDAAGAKYANGNLYGSSKDIGSIVSKLPIISENGGKVNRVGFSRILLEGTMENYGIYHEITEDAMSFDSMDTLYADISRELISGAVQMSEAMLQIDLLDAAGVERFGGVATSLSTMSGNNIYRSVVTYDDLQQMSIQLDNNQCPKTMNMIKGSRMVDTITVDNGRLLYCGSEMLPTLTSMVDYFGKPAFVSVEHYGYSGDHKKGIDLIYGEVGKIGQFRIIIVPEMLSHKGAGALEGANDENYQVTNGHFDVFPLLCIGTDSFTTTGFQTGGSSEFKFKIISQIAGEVVTLEDPYAKTGFTSLEFWYGFLSLRPERIAVQWSLAAA